MLIQQASSSPISNFFRSIVQHSTAQHSTAKSASPALSQSQPRLNIADLDAHSHSAPYLVPALPQSYAEIAARGEEEEGEEEY
jgi:hypothetical protein